MRLGLPFVLAFAAGALGYLVLAPRESTDSRRPAAPAEAVRSSAPIAHLDDTETDAPATAIPQPAGATGPPMPPARDNPTPGRPLAPQAQRPAHPTSRGPTETERVEARARRLAAREDLSHDDVRALLEEALTGRLPDRQLSDADYTRLTDAVLRLRSARRVLQRIDPSAGSAEELARRRADLVDALAELEEVTGVPPSELGDVVDTGEGVSNDGDEDPDEIVHEPITEPGSPSR